MSANTYLPGSPVIPNSLIITNITMAAQAVVTVIIPNYYVVGQIIKLTVPVSYGMYQADQQQGEILAINGLNFTTSINTSQYSPFSIPPAFQERPASLAPVGSRNLYNNTTVPYHALNGTVGN